MVNFKSLQSSLKHIAGVGLSTAASLSILCVFLFLVHVVFQIEFYCTCSGKEQLHCWIYMISPGILISLITLWADKRFRRIYGFTCNSCRYYWYSNTKGLSHFCCSLSLFVFKAVFAGLVWVVSLLLDGDWFACCYNSLSSDERMIPCKENNQLNFTEKMSLREQKNTSMLYGFYLICAMLVVIVGTTCRSGCKCCYSLCYFSNNYIKEFEDNLLEEVETIFAKKLKTISEGYITEKIYSNPEFNILHRAGQLKMRAEEANNEETQALTQARHARTRAEETMTQAEEAEMEARQAKTRAEEAEMEARQAKMRAEETMTQGAEDAEMEARRAKTRAEEAEMEARRAKTRAEEAEMEAQEVEEQARQATTRAQKVEEQARQAKAEAEDAETAGLVKMVKKIDWDKFHEFSYDLILDFEADMKEESQRRENERREPEAGGDGNEEQILLNVFN